MYVYSNNVCFFFIVYVLYKYYLSIKFIDVFLYEKNKIVIHK